MLSAGMIVKTLGEDDEMWRRMVICRARSVFTCLTMYILSGALLCSCAPHHLELTQAETQRSTPSPSSRESSLHTSRKASLKPKNLRPLKAQSQDRDPAHIQALQLPKDELPRACLDIKVQDQGQVSATSLTPQIHTQPSPERGVSSLSASIERRDRHVEDDVAVVKR